VVATDELSVLSGATRYLFHSILLIRETDLSAATPCQAWDLRRLLRHMRASLQQLTDLLAVQGAATDVETDAGPRSDTNPIAALRVSIVELLLAATLPPTAGRWCEIEDQVLPAETVVDVAAIEMVLHAWDIAQACRTHQPVPADLASALLGVAPPLAEAGFAQHVFAEPAEVPTDPTPGDHLVALFGRRPLDRAPSG
jgi:uncharacterized protein (TIGR03086 family)